MRRGLISAHGFWGRVVGLDGLLNSKLFYRERKPSVLFSNDPGPWCSLRPERIEARRFALGQGFGSANSYSA
jgi:hypothetical protein